MKNKIKKIHFIGICGSAMGSVAAMLKEAGYDVQGSDNELYPPMSDYLKISGIKTFSSFSKENITDDVDLVVVGNAVSRGNVELEHILDKKIRFASFPEILREFFIRGKTSIVVTGTHGKTTTSSLVSWILKDAGKKVGFLIGGIPLNFGKGYAYDEGTGGYFVVEGDEYDTAFFDKRSKFMHYFPDVLILNNLEFDHADIFKDVNEIKTSFSQVINIVPQNGVIVANADDDNVREITKKVYSKLVTFSIKDATADYYAQDIAFSEDLSEFDIVKKGEAIAHIATSLKGEHSVYNILAAFTALNVSGISPAEITSAIARFKNVKRRLEKVGEVNGITVYDDFAHHPTAIQKTIAGVIKSNPDKRVIALFEPKSNTSRRNFFQNEFPFAFKGADMVVIGKVYNYEKMSESERLNPFKLVEEINGTGIPAHYFPNIDELIGFVADNAKSGDIILAMSSGSFYGVHKKILAKLQERI